MNNPNYTTYHTEKSFCPGCNKTVLALSADIDDLELVIQDLVEEEHPQYPSFYICFDCRRIFQVGKGEVKVEHSGDELIP